MEQKLNSVSSAGTNDDSSTIADVTTSRPNNAKPLVMGSLLKVHHSSLFKQNDLIDFVEMVDEHKSDFESYCKDVKQVDTSDQLDSDINLLGKQIQFLVNRGYMSNCP